MYLRDHPKPTQKELNDLATATSKRLDESVETIRAWSRPMLQKRGLKAKGGRPSLEERHQRIASLVKTASRSASGRLPAGFWPAALNALTEVDEHDGLTDPQSLWRWYKEHRRRCSIVYPGEDPTRRT